MHTLPRKIDETVRPSPLVLRWSLHISDLLNQDLVFELEPAQIFTQNRKV